MLTTYPQTYLCMHKRQDKLRIAAKLASYRDLTTHALDDGFRQGKTDSDTVRIDLFVDTIETFENIFQFRLRDAAALILHINARVHRIVFRPDMDRRLLAGIVRCIFQQIDDCFGQPVSIADKHLFLVDLHINLLPAFLRQICHTFLRLCHNRIQTASIRASFSMDSTIHSIRLT